MATEADAGEDALVGTMLGPFRIVARLGPGSRGLVYRALDTAMRRPVALEILARGLAPNEDERRGFLREARAASVLMHPNVAPLEAGEAEGRMFLARDLVEGETLRGLLDAGPLALEEAARLARAIAEGLAAAHRAGVAHLDLEAGKVLVTADGRVRVSDFGLARLPARADAGGEQGRTPEPGRGEPAGPQTDVLAFGALLHELVTGRRPAAGASPAGLLATLLATRPRAAPEPGVERGPLGPREDQDRAREPTLERALAAVVLRCLARAPSVRYPSGVELLAELSGEAPPSDLAFLTREPDPEPAPPAPGPAAAATSAPARGRGVLKLVGAMVLVVLLARASAYLLDPASGRPPSVPAHPAEPMASTDRAAGTASWDAQTAFRRGVQAWHDGDSEAAARAFWQARRSDAAYGAAFLWSAMLRADTDLRGARRSLERALALRTGMSPLNQELLAALTPCIPKDRAAPAECDAALDAAARAHPGDAPLWNARAAFLLANGGATRAALDALDDTQALDPRLVPPLLAKGKALAYLGRFDEALATLSCGDRAPGAPACVTLRRWIHAQRGDCAAAEGEARLSALLARAPRPYLVLADAALSRDEPLDAVRDLLHQRTLRAEPEPRPLAAAWERVTAGFLGGDFASVRKGLVEWEAIVDRWPDPRSHFAPRARQLALALETGERDEARDLAEELLVKQAAWPVDPHTDDLAIARDPVPGLLDALRETGKLSSQARAEKRAEWLRAWTARTARFYAPFLWLNAYALQVDDEDEAKEALAALPEGGIPPFYPTIRAEGGIGRMYLFSGHPAEALPYLRVAAQGCEGTEDPSAYVAASLDLGRALEATGDREGACRAYRRVLDRWGQAAPRSTTAEKARALTARLGCPPG